MLARLTCDEDRDEADDGHHEQRHVEPTAPRRPQRDQHHADGGHRHQHDREVDQQRMCR
jgi:hypothetical protein